MNIWMETYFLKKVYVITMILEKSFDLDTLKTSDQREHVRIF